MGVFTQSGRLQILFVKGERQRAEGRRGTMQLNSLLFKRISNSPCHLLQKPGSSLAVKGFICMCI